MRKHFEKESLDYQRRARNLDVYAQQLGDKLEGLLPRFAELSAEAAKLAEEAVVLHGLTRYPEVAAEPLLDLIDQLTEVQSLFDVWVDDVEYLLHGPPPLIDAVVN
jgi:hypothetical protein